jgi:chaperonin GroEL
LAYTHIKGIFKTLIIKAPTLWKDWLYEDFAQITGATIVQTTSGVSFKNLSVEHLGTCDKLITTKEETTVIGIKDISEHIETLKGQGTDDSKIRLAWLQTKAAILKLGANSESELSYFRLKAEDARNASYLALQDGVVAGGGIALFNAAQSLPDTLGGKILRIALASPLEQIIKNTGLNRFDLQEGKDYNLGDIQGFDARTKQLVNMWEAQILDPAKVVKNAIKNALSVASTVLTSSVIITK